MTLAGHGGAQADYTRVRRIRSARIDEPISGPEGRAAASGLKATTVEEENKMKFEMIALGAVKQVVALPHYQTTHRDAPPSLGNEGTSAR
jgi:hypothetical protein